MGIEHRIVISDDQSMVYQREPRPTLPAKDELACRLDSAFECVLDTRPFPGCRLGAGPSKAWVSLEAFFMKSKIRTCKNGECTGTSPHPIIGAGSRCR